MKHIFVEPGDLATGAKEKLVLETFLGSCVGVTLFDPLKEAGGLLHILLPSGPKQKMNQNPSLCAETGIPTLIDNMRQYGVDISRLEAHIAGGAKIITKGRMSNLNIGEQNIIKTQEVLERLKIPILTKSLGGSIGRRLKLFLPEGKIDIKLSRRTKSHDILKQGSEKGQKLNPEFDFDFFKKAAEELNPDSKIAIRALQLVGGDLTTLKELESLILKDQILAGRVLSIVNSAKYGLPQRITKISHAISLLGTINFKKIVMQACVQDLYSRPFNGYGLDEQAFFHHTVACAELAHFLAENTKGIDPEEAYLAALMHDIGKILVERHFTHLFFKVKRTVSIEKIPFLLAEKKILGIDHAQLGRLIANSWQLPLPLEEAIAFHHEPRKAKDAMELVAIVHIANYICNMLGIGLGCDTMANLFDTTSLSLLEMDERTVTEIIRYVPEILFKHGAN